MRADLLGDKLRPYFLAATVGLLVARLFIPSEPPSAGEGIGFVMLWLIVAAASGAIAWQAGADLPRFSWVERLLLLLTGWYVLAALWGMIHGCPRAVINSTCEWLGIVAAFLLLRRFLKTEGECRAVLVVFFCVAGGFALYGVYQYYWEFPALRASFRQDPSRFLQEAGIYLPPGSREASLFLARLRSGEPLATFSLANSLAGFLLVWFVVGLGLALSGLRQLREAKSRPEIMEERRPAGRWQPARKKTGEKGKSESQGNLQSWVAGRLLILPRILCPPGWQWRAFVGLAVALLGVIAWVIILTRSRSAYVATGFALTLFLWNEFSRAFSARMRHGSEGQGFRTGKLWFRKIPRELFFGVLLGLFLGVTAITTLVVFRLSHPGEHQFLSEAVKSLQFRLQYWASTLAMIADMPLLGCGPGNFQIYYTRYMLPEASEVISDPHNFLLELLATGGIPAGFLFGILVAALFVPSPWERLGLGVRLTPLVEGSEKARAAGGAPGNQPDIPAEQNSLAGSSAAGEGFCRKSPPKRLTAVKRSDPAGEGTDGFPPWGDASLAVIVGGGGGVMLAWPLGLLSSVPPSWVAILSTGLPLLLMAVIPKDWWLHGPIDPRWPKIATGALLVHLSASGGITFANVAGSFWILVAVTLALERLWLASGYRSGDAVDLLIPDGQRSGLGISALKSCSTLLGKWMIRLASSRGIRIISEQIQTAQGGLSHVRGLASTLGLVGLCVACYFAAYRPVLGARSVWARIHREGPQASMGDVLELVRRAATQDPLSAESFLALIEGYAREWAATGRPQAAEAFRRNATWFVRISGWSAKAWEVVGDLYWDIGEALSQPACRQEALEAWRQAVQNFPTNGLLRAKVARALAAAGRKEEAVLEARTALELNRRNPHLDRKLPPDLYQEMEKLAAGSGVSE